MDVVLLSRLQFAITTMFHFMFVPLTLGLSVLVAWMAAGGALEHVRLEPGPVGHVAHQHALAR